LLAGSAAAVSAGAVCGRCNSPAAAAAAAATAACLPQPARTTQADGRV